MQVFKSQHKLPSASVQDQTVHASPLLRFPCNLTVAQERQKSKLSSPDFLSRPLHSEKKSLKVRIIYLSILFHIVRESQGADEGVGIAGLALPDSRSLGINKEKKKIKNRKKSSRPN
jgi:hypothetical protein